MIYILSIGKFNGRETVMDLRVLNTFIQVAELGSFTRAAEKLGYSQPTVSLQIRQLEHELGVPLFDRIGHTVCLTTAGREALAHAQHICHLSNEMVSAAGNPRSPSGTIRLAMADSLCTPLIMRGFEEFRRTYPLISLVVVTAGTGDLLRLIDHNEADIVCTLDNHVYDSAYVIASEKKVAVHFIASAESPLARMPKIDIRELIKHPFLLTEKGMSYRRLLDENLARESKEIHPMLEIGRCDLLCSLVAADMGVSFLPDFVTESALQEGKIVRLPVDSIRVEIWEQLLYRRDKWISSSMRAVLRHLSSLIMTNEGRS